MKKRILAILMAAIMCCLQLAEFVPAEKVKAAINKVLEDVPALKPADSGANNNQGFTQIGAPNSNNQQNQDDLLRGIFGIKKK